MNFMRYAISGILLMLPVLLSAQKYSIRGTVLDKPTQKPIVAAMVFLSNTTKGSFTDSLGNFFIDNIEESYFDLVAAPPNYQAVVFRFTPQQRNKKIRFELNDNSKRDLHLKAVKSETNDSARLRNAFLDELKGHSPNADECTVVNPQVLRFQFDSSLNMWSVSATEPLQIFNESLGYKIVSQLEECYMTSGYRLISCTANSWFLPSSSKRKEIITKWEINRIVSFRGSFLHFLQAFYAGKAVEEGFIVRPMKRIYEKYDKETYLKSKNITGNFSGWETDSAGTGVTVLYYVDVVSKTAIDMKKIRIVDSTNLQIFLSFSPSRLQVFYRYQLPLYATVGQGWNPVSYIQMQDNENIQIEPDGMYFGKSNMITAGYWNWLRVADQLPYDYVVPKK